MVILSRGNSVGLRQIVGKALDLGRLAVEDRRPVRPFSRSNSSSRRARALPRVRGRSTVSTTPSSIVMIGFTDSTDADCRLCRADPAAPLQVFERLEHDVEARHSDAGAPCSPTISAALAPTAAIAPASAPAVLGPGWPSRCRRHEWPCRRGSISRATCALAMVADSLAPTSRTRSRQRLRRTGCRRPL